MSRTLRAAAAFGAAALCVSLAACSSGGTVASVNNQNITRGQFDKRLEASPAARQVLSQMVQQDLVDQYATDKKVDVTNAEIDKREAQIKARYPTGQFDQLLKQQGLTEEDVRNLLRQNIVIEKAVAPQVHVTDADVKAYFDKNHALFDKPAQIRARHILVADPKTAQTVLAKLKAGGSWDALAKQYSTDPATKDKGGELGYFGRGQMVPQFEGPAFAANVGQIVGPVKSPFGYHIIQVEDKKPPQKATLANTQDQIRQQLTQQQQQQQIPAFLQQLRANAKIDIVDDRYKDLFPAPLPIATSAPAPAASGK